MHTRELEGRVTDLLMSFKIQPDILGFEYIRTAIMLCYQDDALKNNISKAVYPKVAEICHATAETVERAIRTAVENCFNCGGLLEINEKCGMVVYNNNFKWTNGELISTLTELVRLEDVRSDLGKKIEQLRQQEILEK